MDVAAIAAQIGRDLVEPRAEQVDAAGAWPEEALRALTARIGGLTVPTDFGGLGEGLTGLAAVCEALGQHCASTAICFGMHCVASAVIAAKATPEQVERYLRPVVGGTQILALALSEPGTGAHFWLPETRLRHDEGHFRIEGSKTFVTNGGQADAYVVSGRSAGAAAGPGEFSCVVVPAGVDGMSFGPRWEGIGMRGNSSISMMLENVRVDEGALLGDEGDQIWFVFEVVAPYFLTAMAATYLGIARRALDEARVHLRARRYGHSGQHLADEPVLQSELGDLWIRYEATGALVRHAAALGDGNGDALVALCAAKADAARTANAVVGGAMSLAGGVGYQSGGVFDRMLRNARAADVMSPTTNLLRLWIGRALLDRNLLVDPV